LDFDYRVSSHLQKVVQTLKHNGMQVQLSLRQNAESNFHKVLMKSKYQVWRAVMTPE
jgi:hypothetical protein